MSYRLVELVFLSGFVALADCSTIQATHTGRSTIEQQLLVSSLERALLALDIRSLEGKTVALDFYGLTPDKDFAKEFCTAWLQAKHVRLPVDGEKAQLHLKIFAPTLGVDQGGAFVGVPSVTVPILGFTTPEVSVFKSVTYQGRSMVQIFVFDAASGQFIDKIPLGSGDAYYGDYTILIFIHYTRSDMDYPDAPK